jgi:3' terminal RNA ribose 2'-O-methyltransferase Hen1
MLLTISTTRKPATDLGYLLHKNPARVHSFSLPFGNCYVFYPEAGDEKCTAAMLLEIDPVGLVRGKRGQSNSYPLHQYVNDRPYVASSFLSVAISRVYRNALQGKSKERPDLVNEKMPFEVNISVLPCRGGEKFLRRLFEPMGYDVETKGFPLDEKFGDWGMGPYYSVSLKANICLKDMLSHINVLVPVMDNDKHYWVGDEEVAKLLRLGEGWLKNHSEKDQIANRYLKNRRSLARMALAQLMHEDDTELDLFEKKQPQREETIEERLSLNEERMESVISKIRKSGAKTVLDLGCGEGKLLRKLMSEKQFNKIIGLDVSIRSLEYAKDRLRFDRLPPKHLERIELLHGSLIYRDNRLSGFDAAAVVEVIEHMDTNRLSAFERVLFEFARPKTVVITTPNVDYNEKFEDLPAGKLRHSDHRFEWTRKEFAQWANTITDRFGYSVEFFSVGPVDASLGGPTQMGVFSL